MLEFMIEIRYKIEEMIKYLPTNGITLEWEDSG